MASIDDLAPDVRARAAAWIARLDRDDVSDVDRSEFAAWLAANPRHRDAFESLDGLWSELGALEALARDSAQDFKGEPSPPLLGRRVSRRGAAMFIPAAAAAAIIGVGAALTIQLMPRWGAAATHEYETARGGQRLITLADGSTVNLNSDSRLEARITPRSRDLRLVRGEAYFQVARDPERPFTVFAANGAVRAVGTAFGVQVRDQQLKVTLTKGAVEVAAFKQPLRTSEWRSYADVPRSSVRTMTVRSANVQALVAQQDVATQEIAAEEADRQLAWRDGYIIFAGETLPSAVQELSRYSDMEIQIADPHLNSLRIGGQFKVGQIEPFLEALRETLDVRVERIDQNHVRLTRAY